MLRDCCSSSLRKNKRIRRIDVAAAMLPFALIVAMLGIYLASPTFYLDHVLHPINRETQAVEIITVGCGVLGGLLLMIATVRLWLRDREQGKIRNLPGSALLVGAASLATIFFAGEEVSWGQTWFGGEIPDVLQEKLNARERNLHNSDLPIQSMGSAYLVGMFVLLPIAWFLREKRLISLPNDWGPAVAKWPVTLCIVVALGWKGFKEVYYHAIGEDAVMQNAFYVQFVEQINEQKEMLIALALLMYGVYLLRPDQVTPPQHDQADGVSNSQRHEDSRREPARVEEATGVSHRA